jgi:histidyl-tRNA synthetase
MRVSKQTSGATSRGTIERLRGMGDVWPAEREFRATIVEMLARHFAVHGYRLVDTPVVEATELFLRKSGEERAAQMYAFDYRNRQIALRPEFTASVLRAYIAAGQGRPLPLRLAYCGPVFRYEKPQAGRSRQYTEAGIELLGASGAAADAEVIHVALSGMAEQGLTDCTLRLGHLGVVGVLLNSLALDERVRDWFLWSMEQLRAHGDAGLHRNLRALLAEQVGANGARADETDAPLDPDFPALDLLQLAGMDDDRARATVLGVLRGSGVELEGSNRAPEEIVERLLVKLRRPQVRFDIAGAVEFLRRLVALRGEPATVLAATRALLADYHLDDAPVHDLEEVLALLRVYGHDERITLDLGLGRGLHYYTGVLFEVYDGRDDRLQLCGGGRYDDLAQTLGARAPVPACGFALGVERIAAALQARGAAPPEPPAAEVLVCGSGVPIADLIPIAETLRGAGWRVELDLRGRGLAANLSYAERTQIGAVVICGEAECAAGVVTWRNLATRAEERLSLGALVARGPQGAERQRR